MKIRISIFAVFFVSLQVSAQLKNGFEPSEARDMIALCNSFTFLDLYNSDAAIIPAGYKKVYTSGVFGMDNKYQVYRKGDLGVLNFRGSTEKSISWMENIYSAMIPAKGFIVMQGDTFYYRFSEHPQAAVHAGYALGTAYLAKDIIRQITYMNTQGIYHFILTGHSQGGSLVHLIRAYLESVKGSEISEKNKFKTYAFANPMVGNQAFVDDYTSHFCSDNTSFSIVNPQDPVVNMPLTYGNYSPENILASLMSRETLDVKQMVMGMLLQKYEKDVSAYVQSVSDKLNKQISKELGDVKMPPYLKEIKYVPMNQRIELAQFDYPKVLRDSSILKNDSLMRIYKRGTDGHFTNQEVYKKPQKFYQHKPYNYYVAITKEYFPAEHKTMKKKYLAENL